MKLKKSIFSKLIVSYVVFALVAVFVFVIGLVLEAVSLAEGSPENLIPSNVVDADGNIHNLDSLIKLGGWVEELDEAYRVVATHGEKKTMPEQYTLEELFELTDLDGNSAYIGFWVTAENVDKQFLCMYDRRVMQVNLTVILNELNEVEGAEGRGFSFMWLTLVLIVADVLVLSLYLKRKIKRPLDELVAGMESLKAGRGDVKLHIKTEAEFEQIVDTFNLMAEQLESEKAEKNRLIQRKNQMLLELSHDIRTPIATIKSYANALEAGIVPQEKLQNYYHTIDVKADRVQALSEDMFLMLKMDTADYQVHKEQTNLSEYLRQLCAEYYDEIEEAGFEFQIDIPEEEYIMQLDKALFARVIGNLLNNAKKYNKSGKRIGMELVKEEESLIITVSDDGTAISKELADQMFTAFIRGDAARKTDGGTGLGLAISRLIVEKHGGELFFVRDGEWNRFKVVLNSER